MELVGLTSTSHYRRKRKQLFGQNDITFLLRFFLFTFSFLYHFLHGICDHVDLDFEGLLSNLENALVAFGCSNLAKLWGIRAIVRVDIFVKGIQIMCSFWSACSCIRTEYRKIQTEKSSIFLALFTQCLYLTLHFQELFPN